MLQLPIAVVWDTPLVELELMVGEKARLNGKSFRRNLLPHEQEAKEDGQAFARRLEASRQAKP